MVQNSHVTGPLRPYDITTRLTWRLCLMKRVSYIILMGQCKKDVTPLLRCHWSYVFFALIHRSTSVVCKVIRYEQFIIHSILRWYHQLFDFCETNWYDPHLPWPCYMHPTRLSTLTTHDWIWLRSPLSWKMCALGSCLWNYMANKENVVPAWVTGTLAT